jgi:hypothetical protein
MSRQYDAKNAALRAYPTRSDEGVDLFLTICDMGAEDLEYELGEPLVDYVYGAEEVTA